ncbi:hypothetical protein YQE_02408, partial [Dendroctonus ponderosae]
MIEELIWTTWAKYKKPINDETVLEFGRTIRSHGYEGGQLEIDDSWETCYGSQQFTEEKFANIQNTVNTLHEDGWRVSLWIHPFVNDDCEENSAIGKRLGYFVHNPQNETNAVWWNSDYGHQIDFTKPAAAQWWSDRVKSIQESIGMDSFKFDAGEVDYVNQSFVRLNGRMKQFSLEMLTILALVGVFLANSAESAKVFSSGVVDLYFEESPVEYDFELRRDNVVKMTGIFGKGVDFTNTSPNFNVTIMSVDDGFRVDWRSSDPNFPSTDCLNLQSETLHWYGGPEIYEQKWPIEKLRLSGDDAYVARKDDNFAVEDLQEQGFRVTLWAAPFINPDCTELILEGEEKGYFVQNTIGNMTTVWWESNDARQIDFTNPEASECVLPDMIGGNAYRAQPDLELVIRWTQATVFMPSMQFSFLPWDFEDDEQLKGTEIIRSMVELHTKYAPNIIAAMEEKLINRTPTNPPIWWIVPFDETALGISDEFLLGEDILVAPVMEQGATSRDVYLPEGSWVDGNDPAVKYEGPIWLDYNAPLDVLPYFIKE